MSKLNKLLSLQLEWLEAVKYDEYLATITEYKNNPTRKNRLQWDLKEKEYLKVLSSMDQIIPE